MICVQGYKAFELVEASTDINEIALCKLCHEFVTLFGDARKHWFPTDLNLFNIWLASLTMKSTLRELFIVMN